MRTVLKWIGIVLLGLLGVLLVAVLAIFIVSNSKSNQTFDVPTTDLTIPTDAASIAEGERQINIRACNECHGKDLAGQLFIDDPALGTFYTANITPGGSEVKDFTVADWERAIRHGVDPQGHPLFIMPSTDYYKISDEDLAKMIAYLQSVDPVDQTWPEDKYGLIGRVLVATGQIPFAAEEIDHSYDPPASVPVEVSAAYGEYLAATCSGCHRPNFTGGAMPGSAPTDPPPANLTPAGDLANWTQEQFIHTLRTGETPEGKLLDPQFMPWPITTLMTDDELAAIWLYLSSLPPTETEG